MNALLLSRLFLKGFLQGEVFYADDASLGEPL
jgi:hypothetical protein